MEKIRKVFTGEIKDINEKDNTLISFVSTGAVDRMGDVIEPDGIDLKHYRKNPVVLWAHDYSTPPIGKSLWIKKQDNGIVSKMQFANTAFAQEIFSLYKDGFLKAFSIGFIPKESTPMDEKNESMFGSRRFTKSEMLEYSAVPVPANPEALSLAMQKGLVKDTKIAYQLENSHIDDIEDFYTSNNKETVKVVDEAIVVENKELRDQIDLLEKENAEVKYKLYMALTEKQKQMSEITADSVVKTIEDVTRRVIRQAQGKID